MDEPAAETRSQSVAVVPLHESEWRTFRGLRLEALQESPESFAPTLAEEMAYGEEQWRDLLRRGAVFAAVTGNALIGVVAGITRDPPGLGAMWVDPQWRGAGVAHLMVDAVAAWARRTGHAELTLWAPADNARACRFYEREGFVPTGVSRSFPGQRTAGGAGDEQDAPLRGESGTPGFVVGASSRTTKRDRASPPNNRQAHKQIHDLVPVHAGRLAT